MTRMNNKLERERQLLEDALAAHARIRKLVEVLGCRVPETALRDLKDIRDTSQRAQGYVKEVLELNKG